LSRMVNKLTKVFRGVQGGQQAAGPVLHGPGYFLCSSTISNRGSRGSLPLAAGGSMLLHPLCTARGLSDVSDLISKP